MIDGKKRRRPTALGAYIFAGGFTLGVRRHFDVLAHFEDGPYGVETALRNKLVPEVHTDPATWPVEKFAGKVDFLYGNPPCSPWSMCAVGRVVPWQQDPRVNATRRLFGLIDALRPKVWAWESVRPTFVKGRSLVDAIAAAGAERGYAATVVMVEGSRHGLPQVRARMFVVLSQLDLPWFPTGMKKCRTVGDALHQLHAKTITCAELSAERRRLLRHAEPGERLYHVYDRLHPDRVEARGIGEKLYERPSFQQGRLRLDRPSRVLTGGAHLIHPKEDRLISVEESAALCGYPSSFKFTGAINKQYAQVAQAVMPPVGEYLARVIGAAFAERRRRARQPTFELVEIFTDHVTRVPLPVPVGDRNLLITPPPDTGRVFDRPAKKSMISGPKGVGSKPTRVPLDRVGAPRHGSGYRTRQLLVEGKLSTEEILKTIHREFPTSKATAADVSWNRRKLKLQNGVP